MHYKFLSCIEIVMVWCGLPFMIHDEHKAPCVDEFDQARRNHSADGTWQVRGPGMQACSIASMGPVSATEVGSATADQRFLSWIFEVTKRPVQFFKKNRMDD